MKNTLFQYTKTFLPQFSCVQRKGFSAQTVLLGLAKKWETSLDKNRYAQAVLMDLSKAFDTINNE